MNTIESYMKFAELTANPNCKLFTLIDNIPNFRIEYNCLSRYGLKPKIYDYDNLRDKLKELVRIEKANKFFSEKMQKACENKRVKAYIEYCEKKIITTGYSMGGTNEIEFIYDGPVGRMSWCRMQNDNKSYYRGSAKKYNWQIKYGQVKLVVDMSKTRINLSLVADCKKPFAWDLKYDTKKKCRCVANNYDCRVCFFAI